MRTWRTRGRRSIFEQRPWLVVEHHEVELPDGRVIPDWPWLITPDYVNIVAVTAAGEFLLFRQTKYAVEGTTLAPPGGYLEPGEPPLAAARRELLEETGYAAEEWLDLGCYCVDGNRGAGAGHFFLARGAYPAAPIDADDLEEQELLRLTRPELEAALAAGECKMLSGIAALALALQRLGRESEA